MLTETFTEVKKPSQMLAWIVNILFAFTGQLQWKQLECNILHTAPPIIPTLPSLRTSVIWSL